MDFREFVTEAMGKIGAAIARNEKDEAARLFRVIRDECEFQARKLEEEQLDTEMKEVKE